jgi:hypothetical protein
MDEPKYPPVPLDRVRRTVAIQVQATSLRHVARRIGMSPTGLEKFLRGAEPYSGIRRKLVEWWGREGLGAGAEVSTDLADDALTALVRDLPAAQRRAAMLEMLEVLRAAHEMDGVPVPPWLDELARRHGFQP